MTRGAGDGLEVVDRGVLHGVTVADRRVLEVVHGGVLEGVTVADRRVLEVVVDRGVLEGVTVADRRFLEVVHGGVLEGATVADRRVLEVVHGGVLEGATVADRRVLEDVARSTSVVVGASGWGNIEVVVSLDPENVVGEIVDRGVLHGVIVSHGRVLKVGNVCGDWSFAGIDGGG